MTLFAIDGVGRDWHTLDMLAQHRSRRARALDLTAYLERQVAHHMQIAACKSHMGHVLDVAALGVICQRGRDNGAEDRLIRSAQRGIDRGPLRGLTEREWQALVLCYWHRVPVTQLRGEVVAGQPHPLQACKALGCSPRKYRRLIETARRKVQQALEAA